MPADGVTKLPPDDILSFEDLYRIARQAVALGIDKIRVTGGEPLVRKGVIPFIARLAEIVGVREIVLTTNGLLLRENAAALRRAGVNRLNVSLDSLNAETFAFITRGGNLQDVLDGLVAAEQAGFPPPKIHTVVMRGANDKEPPDFVDLAARKAYTVRFIEYMPTAAAEEWKSVYVPGHEVLDTIRARFSLEPIKRSDLSAPARYFRVKGTDALVGIITPVSHQFCNHCNRIRITATGLAKGCLFSTHSANLKPFLAAGDDALRQALRTIVLEKEPSHRLLQPQAMAPSVAMAQIGG